ncbi:MAG: class I SAM-dependent methyltransferase [Chloroflexota bacterium]
MSQSGADIFAAQPASADELAELYDLEHDDVTEDLVFYRELARRSRGNVLDLGCGSGRLFEALLPHSRRLVGVDGSPALLARARRRIAATRRLAMAAGEGRLELVEGDVATVGGLRGRFGLIVLAGVLPHLDGPAAAATVLAGVRRRLTDAGRVVVDLLGPAALPERDLPLSVDWERWVDGDHIVRRSSLMRAAGPDGLSVAFATAVDRMHPDGTIARLPAGFRLWYPYPTQLVELLEGAGLGVESVFGSHDLDPFDDESERCIVVARKDPVRPTGARD